MESCSDRSDIGHFGWSFKKDKFYGPDRSGPDADLLWQASDVTN